MKRTPIRPVSDRQRVRNAEWARVSEQRKKWASGLCEARIAGVCQGRGLHGHHVIRDRTLNTFENCRWLCSACHRWAHLHPAEAYELGLLTRSASARGTVIAKPPAVLPPEPSVTPRAEAPSTHPAARYSRTYRAALRQAARQGGLRIPVVYCTDPQWFAKAMGLRVFDLHPSHNSGAGDTPGPVVFSRTSDPGTFET